MGSNDNINDYFDFSKLNQINPRKGKVLISEPFLEDDYFTRSVVLLCDHNDSGSFGFVLNNYIDQSIAEIVEGFPEFNAKVSIGGPVETNLLFFIHNRPDIIDESIKITDTIYMGGSFEAVKEQVISGNLDPSNIKFFLGYSGWGELQLKEEIDLNSWFVANVGTDTIMSYTQEDMWERILENMSDRHKLIATFPNNPNLN